jgi:hypothetical protein
LSVATTCQHASRVRSKSARPKLWAAAAKVRSRAAAVTSRKPRRGIEGTGLPASELSAGLGDEPLENAGQVKACSWLAVERALEDAKRIDGVVTPVVLEMESPLPRGGCPREGGIVVQAEAAHDVAVDVAHVVAE